MGAYYASWASGGKEDPSQAEWKTKAILAALIEIARAHSMLMNINDAALIVEKLGSFLPEIFDSDRSNDKLRYLDCLLFMKQHECLEYQRRGSLDLQRQVLEKAEESTAEMLLLSNQVNDQAHYARALSYAVFIAVVWYRGEDGYLSFFLEDKLDADVHQIQLVSSLREEAERLAHETGLGLLGALAESGFLYFKEKMWEKAIEKLLAFAREFIREYYNFVGVSASQSRISYHESWKSCFRTLQVALMKVGRPMEALVWAERERARDSNLLLNNARHTYSHEAMEFDMDDKKALDGILSIPANEADTVFLIYTALIGNRGICSYMVHSKGVYQHYINLNGVATLATYVEETLGYILEGGGLDVPDLKVWYSLLIYPFEEKLKQIKPLRLVIIPAEEFASLPFGALLKNADDDFLIEKYAISYVPSMRMYKHCCLPRTNDKPKRSALVLGNPKGSFLPRAENEAGYVKKELERVGYGDVELLQTEAATKDALVRGLSGSDWVHFAGHAHVSSNFPHGVLQLATPTEELPASLNNERSIEEQLEDFLNDAPGSSKLTGDDILQMKVRASTVILSACSSGRGEICSEGVIGLYRSLHLAGVQSVVSSLWTVKDQATEFLMQELYKNMSNGMELVFALQDAMKRMINDELKGGQGFSVKHWAPFIISGNPYAKLC